MLFKFMFGGVKKVRGRSVNTVNSLFRRGFIWSVTPLIKSGPFSVQYVQYVKKDTNKIRNGERKYKNICKYKKLYKDYDLM